MDASMRGAGILLAALLWMLPISNAESADFERLSCSGIAQSPSAHHKFPATVRNLPIGIDFENEIVSGLGVRLNIISSWRDQILVAGSYRDAVGLVRVTGEIELWSGGVHVRATRGRSEGGPLVFLWDLACNRAS
jgi:hypothetical protein